MNGVTIRTLSRLTLLLTVPGAALAVRAEEDGSLRGADVAVETPALRVGAVIPIHGALDGLTEESVARRLAVAREGGATVIVFELDTPGGLVSSSIALADMIKNLPDEITSVAWVNTNAHSGGSIVAVACDEIVMAKSSRIGDSQVIMGTPVGAEAIPDDLKAKANTPVIAEFRASAKRNGYDQILCEAFVLPEREVWWLEDVETGEREFVFRAEKLERLGQAKVFGSEPAEPGRWKLVEKYHDPVLDVELDVHQPIVSETELLEMSAGEAQAYGFSKGVVKDQNDLRSRYGLSDVLMIEPTWSEHVANWMTSMYVRGFLLSHARRRRAGAGGADLPGHFHRRALYGGSGQRVGDSPDRDRVRPDRVGGAGDSGVRRGGHLGAHPAAAGFDRDLRPGRSGPVVSAVHPVVSGHD
jgi:hypothetical protein